MDIAVIIWIFSESDLSFGMVSLKLWVGEEKCEPDYFKMGKKNYQGISPNINI